MNIAGFEKNSFVDYPGLIAAVVFTPGCNYDCFFCHNRMLLDGSTALLDTGEVMAFLERRRGLIDGVVISGGEPTMQSGLEDFIRAVRGLGYSVKLDTNGSQPGCLASLINQGLVDYVAMDYKAPFDRYRELCGPGADPRAFMESLAVLRTGGVAFELRTTFIPQLSPDDIEAMVARVAPVPRYALQAYRVPPRYRPEDRFRVLCAPHSADTLRQTLERVAPLVGQAVLRD